MKETVIIAGSGRSGTTWVQDSLAAANNMRTLFEPLKPDSVSSAADFAYQYVDVHANNDELTTFMEKVFSGEMRSIWVNYRLRPDGFNVFKNGLKDTYFYLRKSYRHYKKYGAAGNGNNGMIVKFIRANLMLPWIVANFNIRTALIIRHPCAVVASRLKLPRAFWGAEMTINRYRKDPAVVELVMNEFGVDIGDDMSAASALTCVWCIENLLPIRWAAESNYDVFAYENLLADDGSEWGRLVTHLGLARVPESSLLESPSQQVSPEMRNRSFTSRQLGKWQTELESQALSDIEAVLDGFGCDYYSVDDWMPRPGYGAATET